MKWAACSSYHAWNFNHSTSSAVSRGLWAPKLASSSGRAARAAASSADQALVEVPGIEGSVVRRRADGVTQVHVTGQLGAGHAGRGAHAPTTSTAAGIGYRPPLR